MNQHTCRPVLAIGLDAAEPSLIRHLIDQDEMPALKSLLAEGKWMRVQSPAHLGSGSVWPTFVSGEEPLTHGIYGEWCWLPETMSLRRYEGNGLQPFWKTLAETGFSVGILDAPLVTMVGLTEGFEIFEWGAHDALGVGTQVGPPAIADFLASQSEVHPLSTDRNDNANPNDSRELGKLSAASLKGVKLRGQLARDLLTRTRPDFALIIFPEIHHSSHYVWHTSEFDPQVHSGFNSPEIRSVKPSLTEIFREVDRQIASLIEAAGSDHAVMVFSLHGMRAAAGVPAFLQPLLCERGFAHLTDLSMQSWAELARSIIAAVKRHTPTPVKKLYYRALDPSTTWNLARSTMLPVYDWARTRAFSLPTDQHGWIRINLRGRESAGIVLPQDYTDTCRQLEELMRGLSREDGQPLVDEVIRTSADHEEARCSKLPDLVVHWSDAAFAANAGINDSGVPIKTIGTKFTAQHAPDGFCILKGGNDLCQTDFLSARDMHLLITGLLTGGRNQAKRVFDEST